MMPDAVVARVAWFYYEGNLTQQQIADRLGLSRLRVNRMLAQARADGSVQVQLRHPLAECVALEAALVARYGLDEAAVVPDVLDYAERQRVVGEAAGVMLDRLLQDGQSVGVGWGRTLRASLHRVRARTHFTGGVVSLMGGLTRGSGTNTFEVSTRLAETLSAECWYLAAPIYCPSEASRDALLTHSGLSAVLKRAREVSVALVSCGDFSEHSLLAGTPTVAEYEAELRVAGAVGDVLGTFLDADGVPVVHALNRRVMALSPADLQRVPTSILASGGLNKAAVIRAILRAGIVRRLVTDEAVAQALVEGT